jgi:hypothetical protein
MAEHLRLELADLVTTGAVSMVDFQPWCVLPLQLVHRPDKKPRVVIDGSRQINPYLFKRGVRLSTLHQFNEGVSQGDYWASLDLKAGY